MARQRSHSIEFKRQVAQEFIAGESLYALSKRHAANITAMTEFDSDPTGAGAFN